MDSEIEPRFTHDCSKCKFLGHHNKADLYFCDQAGNPTVLARHGNKGPDYDSGIAAASYIPQLTEALKRARLLGFV